MKKPLSGIRVLELSHVLAGPTASLIMGDLGADVIKIEQPGSGDLSRGFGPFFKNGQSVYFMCMNRNKRSLTLDMKTPQAKEIFYDLVKKSDVVLEANRPGVTQRLKIDYETLKEINPKIVYCSLTGYGQEGPYKDKPAFDMIIQAVSGVMSVTGEPGRPPVLSAIPIADISSAHLAVVGILSALLRRERSGEGEYIDIAMMDVMLAMLSYMSQFYLSEGMIPEPVGSGHPTNIPVRAVKTKDDKYIEVYSPPQRFYEKLALVVSQNVEGLEELPSDPRFANPTKRFENRHALYDIMDKAFLAKTADEWIEILDAADVPCGQVNTLDQAFNNPQVPLRNMTVEIDHPHVGKFRTVGNPIKFSQMKEEFKPSPLLGEHSEEILTQILGYSPDDAEKLRQDKVI